MAADRTGEDFRAEIRGTFGPERADRIVHHLAEVHREIAAEPGMDAWDKAEMGRLADIPKNEVHRRIRDDEEPTNASH